MANEFPLVSVIMSVYNMEEHVATSINSILNQSLSDFEFLIMDDGSTDQSFDILKEYEASDKRVKVFHQKNQGLTYSLNLLLNKVNGKYIARMDADDISDKYRFEKQVRYLQSKADVSLVTCWGNIFYDPDLLYLCNCVPDNSHTIKLILSKGFNPIMHSSVMLRNDILEKYQLRYRYRFAQDYDLWCRLSEITEFGVVTEYLHFLRMNNKSISSKHSGHQSKMRNEIHNEYFKVQKIIGIKSIAKGLSDIFCLVKKKSPSLDPKNFNNNYTYGRACLYAGEKLKARKFLLKAFNLEPANALLWLRIFQTYLPLQLLSIVLNYELARLYGKNFIFKLPFSVLHQEKINMLKKELLASRKI